MTSRIDLHVHTQYSHDSTITPKELAFYAKYRGLDGVAIVDHDTTKGVKRFNEVASLVIIPGVETTTAQGHVLALGVQTPPRSSLSFADTVDQVHDAGGLAVIAHPTGFLKGVSEEECNEGFDAVEVVNSSRVPFSLSVRRSQRIAAKLGLPQTGGSDAHYAPEVGMAYTLVDAEKDLVEILNAIRRGDVSPQGRAIPWSMRLKRSFARMKQMG